MNAVVICIQMVTASEVRNQVTNWGCISREENGSKMGDSNI